MLILDLESLDWCLHMYPYQVALSPSPSDDNIIQTYTLEKLEKWFGFSEQKSADTLCPHSERKQLWLYTAWLKKPKEMFPEVITYIGSHL